MIPSTPGLMDATTCQNCNTPLPPSIPGGLCPVCLRAEAMGSLDSIPGETAGHSPTPSFGTDPLEGSSLGIGGRYKILQRIGEGGFGTVLITVQHGAEPVPKVIDFGVAKAMETPLTDKTLFTRFEQMIGTPAYMSPEQAGAAAATDIDTRTDIYALGVLLYELLTGTTPVKAETLQQAAFDEVRRILREEDAPRPSARLSSLEQDRRTTVAKERGTEPVTLDKQVRGDLDWIVMCAIEKDRRRRYETANALARDVKRHLGDEPVTAGAPSAAYRTRKFIRRHRRWISVGTAAGVIMVAATAFSLWQTSGAIDAEQRSTTALGNLKVAYNDLDAAKREADAARSETRTILVNTLLEEGTRKFNQGEVVGLITLKEAVQAAAGDEALEHQALELWSVAREWLPGEVREVFDEPSITTV